jgi:hypothetical protein
MAGSWVPLRGAAKLHRRAVNKRPNTALIRVQSMAVLHFPSRHNPSAASRIISEKEISAVLYNTGRPTSFLKLSETEAMRRNQYEIEISPSIRNFSNSGNLSYSPFVRSADSAFFETTSGVKFQ